MPGLTIELKKTKDGRPSLACVRADGSRTWARVHPFFPTHDLTHCAVESVLGFDEAFFGLIASGWEVDEFAAPGASKRTPAQALCAEHVVGHLERGVAATAADLNAAIAATAAEAGVRPCVQVSEVQLAAIRALRSRLVHEWIDLGAGDTMRVAFPAD